MNKKMKSKAFIQDRISHESNVIEMGRIKFDPWMGVGIWAWVIAKFHDREPSLVQKLINWPNNFQYEEISTFIQQYVHHHRLQSTVQYIKAIPQK